MAQVHDRPPSSPAPGDDDPAPSSTTHELEPGGRSTTDGIIHYAFVVFVVGVLVFGLLDLLGPRDAVVQASGERLEIALRYDRVIRPGLAATWELEVTTTDGGPLPPEVEVRTSSSYLDVFDENGIGPEPRDQTADAQDAVWTFDTDPGARSLVVAFDARVQPGWRAPVEGTTTVTAGDAPPLAVRYRTWILP